MTELAFYQTDESLLIKEISDIHAHVERKADSLTFPGPQRAHPALIGYIGTLVELFSHTGQDDATLRMKDGSFWRGHRDTLVVDGAWIRFRKMPSKPPKLEQLPSPMPEWVRLGLLEPESTAGGLILVCGATGQGKTTTASAVVVSRLEKFAGVAYTVEQPPEHPLHGWHAQGFCTQTWVKDDGQPMPWARAMRSVLRSQPARTAAILFLGEVREEEAARVAVQAASQGFLVVATSFASDMVSGVSTFGAHLTPEGRQQFAHQLRTVVYQNIRDQLLEVKMLKTTPQVVQHIATEKYSHLAGELQQQSSAARVQAMRSAF